MLEYNYMKKDQTYHLKNRLKGNKILSARQTEILTLLAVGHTNREIAEQFGISLHTVKTHLYRALHKFKGDMDLARLLKGVNP